MTIRRKGFSTDLLTETTQIWGIGVPRLHASHETWELPFFTSFDVSHLSLHSATSELPSYAFQHQQGRSCCSGLDLSLCGRTQDAHSGWHVVACQWIPWRGRSASCQDIPGLAGLRAVATGARLIDDSKWTTRQPAPIKSRGVERNRI